MKNELMGFEIFEILIWTTLFLIFIGVGLFLIQTINNQSCVEEKVQCYKLIFNGKFTTRYDGDCLSPEYDRTEKVCVKWEKK